MRSIYDSAGQTTPDAFFAQEQHSRTPWDGRSSLFWKEAVQRETDKHWLRKPRPASARNPLRGGESKHQFLRPASRCQVLNPNHHPTEDPWHSSGSPRLYESRARSREGPLERQVKDGRAAKGVRKERQAACSVQESLSGSRGASARRREEAISHPKLIPLPYQPKDQWKQNPQTYSGGVANLLAPAAQEQVVSRSYVTAYTHQYCSTMHPRRGERKMISPERGPYITQYTCAFTHPQDPRKPRMPNVGPSRIQQRLQLC
ncbi:hypothetical protein CYMTET_15431 [Cymbomonas tetramitiformis]|uniref:Uncharacterized protein n=1 Tax=Cymbomonas tetramitiformis TaxID=36881 RepID=A0AAE0GFH7_9CHLO|nr:hypothetical protein CYMTET_15431 [Cymbomonas tetramitiformis]